MQALLKKNTVIHNESRNLRGTNLLTGLIFDTNGTIYSPSFTQKGPDKRRYRYYINRSERDKRDVPDNILLRLPSQETEELVERSIRAKLTDIHECADFLGVDLIDNQTQLHKIKQDQAALRMTDFCRAAISRIIVEPEKLTIIVKTDQLAELVAERLDVHLQIMFAHEKQLIAPIQPAKGKRGTLMIEAPTVPDDILDLPLAELKKLVQGFIWMEEHFSGRTLRDIAHQEKFSDAHIGKTIIASLDNRYAEVWTS